MEAIDIVPKTAVGIYKLLPEGTRCEVINNVIYMSAAAGMPHQRLLHGLYDKIKFYISSNELGEVYMSVFFANKASLI